MASRGRRAIPYAKNGDISIYYEVVGEGPPLVMLHGLTASSQGWKETGYVALLEEDYRIILLDFRGHGKSDKPHEPARYTSENIVGDVVAVLDELGIAAANFYGYSYGGGIAFELAKYAPKRIKSAVVGGVGARLPSPEQYEGLIKFLENEAEALTAKRKQGDKLSPQEAYWLTVDREAITAICRATLSGQSPLDAVPEMRMPFLIFAGEADPGFPGAKETADLLPNATFVSFPGLDHMQAGSRLDLVIPLIKTFLARVNQT